MPDSRFTIVIPAFNGGDYLRQCIRSVLAQTYLSFDVVILDDGSTDGTPEWAASLGDPRLRLSPAPSHLGIVGNWQRILQTPRAEYMTILGQDDWLEPDYLRVMDMLILRHPDAGLYHAHFRFVDAQGQTLRPARPLPETETDAQYLAALFSGERDTYGSGYMMRSADYDRVGGIPAYEKLLFADDVLWMKLMEGTYKAAAAETLFACRLHSSSVSGGTPWPSWLNALTPYVTFLNAQAQDDPLFDAAYNRYGSRYIAGWGRSLYTLALTQATYRNRRIDRDAHAEIARILTLLTVPARLRPEDMAGWDSGFGMRSRELINRFAVLRHAYSAYVRVRYGRKSAQK